VVATADIAGLRFAVAPAIAPQPLRSDVAGFIGPTARGPIGVPIRIVGWREYLRVFGPLVAGNSYVTTIVVAALLWASAFTLYAVRYWPVLTRPRVDGRPG